jgi:hypothetical protein
MSGNNLCSQNESSLSINIDINANILNASLLLMHETPYIIHCHSGPLPAGIFAGDNSSSGGRLWPERAADWQMI